MARVKQSLLGFWVLTSIAFFKGLFHVLAYLSVRDLQLHTGRRFTIQIMSPVDKIVLSLLLAEALVYWTLRFKIHDIRWVRWHAWTLFFFMVVFPLVAVGLTTYLSSILSPSDYSDVFAKTSQLRFYLFWIIFPGAHIFFIATIVKSFRPVKELNTDEPPGLLDEFVT